jgi:hypothetical protein
MDYDFGKIQGPRQSKRENFEELISQLLAAEMKAEAVDGSGGDEGVDCFVKLDGNKLVVFQSKYFTTRLTPSHRKQIERSLETARKDSRLKQWVLCVPVNPTPGERRWFESLSKDGLTMDWWGETKIRTLIAEHPEIALAFFVDASLTTKFESFINRFSAFERNVTQTMDVLKASRWSRGGRKASYSVAYEYLERATDIGNLLIEDASLLNARQDVYIGIDFSEIYTYMSSDPRLVISTPVVDFCIQNSPQPLYFLPGTVFELSAFLRSQTNFSYSRLNEDVEVIKGDAELFRDFIRFYEQDQTSKDTYRAYQRAIKRFKTIDAPVSFNLRKLKTAFESGRLMPTPDVSSNIQINEYEAIHPFFRDMEEIRPRRTRANFVDARNLVFLKNYMDRTGGRARMLSSDRCMAAVSRKNREYLGEAFFVRDSSEYAYLIHAGARLDAADSEERFKSQAGELQDAAEALREVLKSPKRRVELITSGDTYLRALLNAFSLFAPHYRTVLRPVDEMIESGLLALSSTYAQDMWELYEILKSKSDLVASFKSWWEYMCQELKAIDDILVERYDREKIASEFKLMES